MYQRDYAVTMVCVKTQVGTSLLTIIASKTLHTANHYIYPNTWPIHALVKIRYTVDDLLLILLVARCFLNYDMIPYESLEIYS